MTVLQKVLIAAIVILGMAVGFGARAQSDKPMESAAGARPEGIASATAVTLHGKIVEIDKTNELVVVQGPEGRKVDIKVQNPANLAAVKVGDPIVARFYEIVSVRKKKPGEEVPTASLKSGIVTAARGATPGAVAEQNMTLLVSVVAIDSVNGTVTIKGPDGSMETVKAKNPKNLNQFKAGDKLVVSVSRALGISLEKESGG